MHARRGVLGTSAGRITPTMARGPSLPSSKAEDALSLLHHRELMLP
jgi:hypothetical protein